MYFERYRTYESFEDPFRYFAEISIRFETRVLFVIIIIIIVLVDVSVNLNVFFAHIDGYRQERKTLLARVYHKQESRDTRPCFRRDLFPPVSYTTIVTRDAFFEHIA